VTTSCPTSGAGIRASGSLRSGLDLAALRARLGVDGASERAWTQAVTELVARTLAEARGEP
jgi:hypothetical protein